MVISVWDLVEELVLKHKIPGRNNSLSQYLNKISGKNNSLSQNLNKIPGRNNSLSQ
jgi:hypothetical protein